MLIHELIATEVWKQNVFTEILQQQLEQKVIFPIYMVVRITRWLPGIARVPCLYAPIPCLPPSLPSSLPSLPSSLPASLPLRPSLPLPASVPTSPPSLPLPRSLPPSLPASLPPCLPPYLPPSLPPSHAIMFDILSTYCYHIIIILS